jgi:hypothetical protein
LVKLKAMTKFEELKQNAKGCKGFRPFVFSEDELTALLEAWDESKWKPYPKFKDEVISDQLYVVTLSDLTVHSVYGMSFEQIGVIAFHQPAPYRKEE